MEPTFVTLQNEPGRDDWGGAARIAASCPSFHPDEEDEQVADEPRSCFNCRYRRWTAASYTCCKEMLTTV
jgi:hypothetical protein